MGKENLRFELRAYEAPNACRLAGLLLELTSGNGSVTRDAIADRWARRYPRHAAQTGRKNVRSRIGYGLTMLKVANIARADGDQIEILNPERLRLSAGNLIIVQDHEGEAIPPGCWSRRPAVPEHLLAVVFECQNEHDTSMF